MLKVSLSLLVQIPVLHWFSSSFEPLTCGVQKNVNSVCHGTSKSYLFMSKSIINRKFATLDVVNIDMPFDSDENHKILVKLFRFPKSNGEMLIFSEKSV